MCVLVVLVGLSVGVFVCLSVCLLECLCLSVCLSARLSDCAAFWRADSFLAMLGSTMHMLPFSCRLDLSINPHLYNPVSHTSTCSFLRGPQYWTTEFEDPTAE